VHTPSIQTNEVPHPTQVIGALAGAPPEALIYGDPDQRMLAGAIWSHAPMEAEVAGLSQHALALHLSGCTLVEKWCGGRLLGQRARIGSVSLVPAEVRTQWVLGGFSRVAHVYIDPRQLELVNCNFDYPLPSIALHNFFAQDDLPLAALTKLVLTHGQCGTLDRLAHEQAMTMLARYLLIHYGCDAPAATHAHAVPRTISLTKPTLARVFAYIEEHLASELRLTTLAAVARVSEDHFIRAFRREVGQTPHRYVLARRIERAKQLLRHWHLPLTQIAAHTGFKSASHFAAAFRQQVGTAPSAWRADQSR
jgi:AraC family transcriptional regulator